MTQPSEKLMTELFLRRFKESGATERLMASRFIRAVAWRPAP